MDNNEIYTLTKEDIQALRKANSIVIKRTVCNERAFDTVRIFLDRESKNTYEFTIKEFYFSSSVKRACAHISIYNGESPSSIFGLLRAGDVIQFHWYKDGHTNQYMERAGLHGDFLVMVIQRGKKRLKFEIASSICEQNTARMIDSDKSSYEA